MHIRTPTVEELARLAAIERDADQLYIDTFGDAAHDLYDEVTVDGVGRSARPGFILVAGEPVAGFAHVVEEDAEVHLEQLSVQRSAQQRGIGSALIREVMAEAAARGYAELSLCTFAELAWNEPFYRRFGFEPHAWDTPFRRRLLANEEVEGLAQYGRRLLMVASLEPRRVGPCLRT